MFPRISLIIFGVFFCLLLTSFFILVFTSNYSSQNYNFQQLKTQVSVVSENAQKLEQTFNRPGVDPKNQKKWIKALKDIQTAQRKEKFEKIFKENTWSSAESRSGKESTVKQTTNIRILISKVLKEFEVHKFIDSPCGDCNWQHLIEGIEKVDYLGLDISPSAIEFDRKRRANMTNFKFEVLDFSNNEYPYAPDLILCRDMIQHNTLQDGYNTYYNIEISGAKYLITNWFRHPKDVDIMKYNKNIETGDFYRIDVFLHPFNFSKPLF